MDVLKDYYSTQKSLYGICDSICEVLEHIIDVYSNKGDIIHCCECNKCIDEDALIV